jgi:hypothetical protein
MGKRVGNQLGFLKIKSSPGLLHDIGLNAFFDHVRIYERGDKKKQYQEEQNR